jgi:signal recognition particle subunit SRP54
MFDFLTQKFSDVFSSFTGQKYLTEKNIEQSLQKVQDALIQADVPFALVESFVGQVRQDVIGKKILTSLNSGEQFIKVVHDQLVTFLGGVRSVFSPTVPSIIMMMGLQGSGKTTTIAKLAHSIKAQSKKRSIVCASIDFARPAALDQLEILAKQAGISFYKAHSTDPVEAAKEIVHHFRQNRFDILFFDTAGRLHVDNALLQELRAVDAAVSPTYKILVLDAMTGQESLRVGNAFNQAIGFNGAILTKLDSDTRAGAAFAFAYEIKKPIWFVGVGEKIDELEPFKADRIAGRIIGMGDVHTLLERAQQKIAYHEQKEAEGAFKKGTLTLEDFAKQLSMMNKIGSFSSILKYMPGMSSMAISPDMIQKGELQMKRFRAIIDSMTPVERRNVKVLNSSRKERIARGAGVQVGEVDILLNRFEQTQQFVKLLKKSGKFPSF